NCSDDDDDFFFSFHMTLFLAKKNNGIFVFYQRQNSFILQNVNDATPNLGSETGVYHVKFGLAYFGLYALCIGLSGLGLLVFLGASTIVERIVAAVFLAVTSLPLIFLVIR